MLGALLFGHRTNYWVSSVTGVVVTLVLITITWYVLASDVLQRFESDVNYRKEIIAQRLTATDVFAEGVASYLDVTNIPDAALFRNYLSDPLSRQTHIRKVLFLSKIPGKYRDRFEKALNKQGFKGFYIKQKIDGNVIEAKQSDSYFPALLVEPRNIKNIRLIGFDFWSEENFQQAMRTAIDSGTVARSALIRNLGKAGQTFWVFKAIYGGKEMPTSKRRRQQYINGFAAFELDLNQLVSSQGSMPLELELISSDALIETTQMLDLLPWRQGRLFSRVRLERPGYELNYLASRKLNWLELIGYPLLISLFIGIAIGLLLLLNTRNNLRRHDTVKALQESDRRIATLMSNLPGMAYRRYHADIWRLEFFSQGSEGLTGFAHPPDSFDSLVHPDDLTRLKQEASDKYQLSYRIVTAREEVKWVLDYGQKAYTKKGREVHEGFIMDISERKRAADQVEQLNQELEHRVQTRTAELEDANRNLESTLQSLKNAQSQLVESEKMAALGNLVAGVAHEINTPIGTGVTAASYVKEQTQEVEEVFARNRLTRDMARDYLQHMRESAGIILSNLERAAELIGSFKAVAVDQTSEERRTIKLDEYFREVLVTLKPELKKAGHVVVLNCDESIELNTYPSALAQIITNLVMNSLKHAFDVEVRGEITIKLEQRNAMVVFEYMDNGKGVSEEVAAHMFDPFFTTKRNQGGTGLGMHLVYNLVNQKLAGQIELLEPNQGKGIRLQICWPLG